MTTWRSRAGSRSAAAAEMVQQVEREIRTPPRYSFRSLAAALAWYWLMRERMQAPLSPQLDQDRSIEGGPGGDLDGALITVSVIGEALHELQLASPRQFSIIVATKRDGESLRQISQRVGLSHQQVSLELGRGEAWLTGWLRRAEVLA